MMNESQLLARILTPCNTIGEAEKLYTNVLLYWRQTSPASNPTILRSAIHTLQRFNALASEAEQAQVTVWIQQLDLAASVQD